MRKRARGVTYQLLTDDEYDRLLAAQGGRCALCPAVPKTRRLNADHDHGRKDQRVRGLLCHRCNRYLPAWMRPDWLRRAADYLENPPALAVLGGTEYDHQSTVEVSNP